MKKMFFLAATAALALSSCSSDEIVQGPEANLEDGAVSFGAYVGRDTRAAVTSLQSVKAQGFGVFAYEQGTTPWDTYRASNTVPNFFYNQKVAYEFSEVTIKTPITIADYGKITDGTLRGKYAAAGQYTSSASASKDDIALINASSLTASDFLGTSVSVTYKSSITQAEKEAATNIGASVFTGGSGDDNTPLNTTGSVDLTTYLTYTDGDLAVITGASVEYKTPLTHTNYNLLAASSASALTTHYSAATAPNDPKYTASDTNLTKVQYEALSTNFDRSLVADVTSSTDKNFEYSPIKYYSNNDGANHSFFAYAPYNPSAKVVFSPEGPSIRYNAVEDYDLLWAAPAINQKKGTLTTGQVITFDFGHALSKVSFEAGTFVDQVHGNHTSPGLSEVAEGTIVKLRSVKFVGNVPSQGRMSLTTGDFTVEASEEGAYEFCPAAGVTFNSSQAGYTLVSSDNMVIPNTVDTEVKIQVVYDVITTDEHNPKNNSTVTNVITSDPITLEKGTAYLYKLDLGLTSVKFNATMTNDWTAPTEKYVDLTNNELDSTPSNRR